MFRWLSNLASRLFRSAGASRQSQTPPTSMPRERFVKLWAEYAQLRAKYDAAVTNDENRRHWSNADSHDAASANDPHTRRILRNRSRYEDSNNGYAQGIVETRADDLVGTGPTLQILTDDDELNERIESAFRSWARACKLAEKLHIMDMAECRDGEAFAILINNPALRDPVLDNKVELDLLLIEADQVADPHWGELVQTTAAGNLVYDGVEYDRARNPVSYTVLRDHPGGNTWAPTNEYDVIPARYVLHSYRCRRPGQVRGVPELTSSLPMFAYLRRWTLATLSAAEIAAAFAAMMETEAPPEGVSEEITPFDKLEIERGMLTALPSGSKLHQLQAEQPTTNYPDFKREVLNECGRPVQMPSNIVVGDSSRHNFSSAKLDHLSYRNGIRVRRFHRAENILEKLLRAWVEEARLVPGVLPVGVDVLRLPRQWFWPGWQSWDKNEAQQDTEQLQNGTTTLAELLGEWGLDWKSVIRQRGRELKFMAENGVPPPSAAASPARTPARSGASGGQRDVEEMEEDRGTVEDDEDTVLEGVRRS